MKYELNSRGGEDTIVKYSVIALMILAPFLIVDALIESATAIQVITWIALVLYLVILTLLIKKHTKFFSKAASWMGDQRTKLQQQLQERRKNKPSKKATTTRPDTPGTRNRSATWTAGQRTKDEQPEAKEHPSSATTLQKKLQTLRQKGSGWFKKIFSKKKNEVRQKQRGEDVGKYEERPCEGGMGGGCKFNKGRCTECDKPEE